MRIVYDYQTFCMQEFGGISRYFCELSANLSRRDGIQTEILAPLHRNEHASARGVPTRGRRTHLGPRAAVPLCAIDWLALAALRPPAVDILHETYFQTLPTPVRCKARIVTVYDMIHELFPSQFGRGDTTSLKKRRAVARADHVLCISHNTAKDLVRLFSVPERKVSVVHLGYFRPGISAQERAPRPAPASPFVLFVGQRAGYKNFDLLLRAFAASTKLSKDFSIVCFGGGALSSAERALIAELGIDRSRVRQQGGTDAALERLYLEATAFVYPSRYEGFGLPPLEAMWLDCPVVSGNASSLPEVVGDAARLIDPTSVDDLRAGLEDVCYDSALRDELVRRGREQARKFSWDRCADETLAVYRRALESRS
jgi:glycosyltransferase involved in cell wall biosynthesis